MLLAVIMVCSTSMTAFASTTSTPYIVSETNSNVVVTDTGIYVNGTYYSEEQFIRLLDTAQEIETPQTHSAALVAGTWLIPGIGQVIVTAAGAVIVAGAVVEVGSWVYNAVVDWFADRAVQQAYEDAKKMENLQMITLHKTHQKDLHFLKQEDLILQKTLKMVRA